MEGVECWHCTLQVADGRLFAANDPDHLLHGEEGVHEKEEEDEDEDDRRARNLKFSPDVADGQVGSITREDFLDYQDWRKKKRKRKKDTNWMSGFSYISDSIVQNIDAIKERYFSFFSNSSSSSANASHDGLHDEA